MFRRRGQAGVGFVLPALGSLAVLAAAACSGGGGGSVATPASATTGATAATVPVATATGGEMPTAADTLVDSVGVNVHLSYYSTLYGENFAAVQGLLSGLGVRHVRDGAVPGQTNICAENEQLAAAGIHVDDITQPSQSQATLATWIACNGSALEALEGPNEYDISHGSDPNWVSTLQAYQPQIYATAKSVAPALTVYGPSLTTESAFAAVGDLSASEDAGNMHDYFAGRNPGTTGWGSTDTFGTYGSLPWNIAIAKQASSGRPIVSTETGYVDGAGATNAVPAATKARYDVRTLLEHWRAGVDRTYLYELIDEGSGAYATFGLADATGATKPAYVELANLLSLLTDKGAAFTPAPLHYTLATSSASVHHVLAEKRDGTYLIILWVEAPEWDPTTNTALSVAAQSATLTFASTPSSATMTQFSDTGAMQSSALSASAMKASFSVTNQLEVMTLHP
jgi:hypothetical protein